MSNELRHEKPIRSWAVGISLLLHCLVLLGLGVGTLPGSSPQPDTMAVYLAMPSAVSERVSLATSGSGHETVHKPVQFQSFKQVQPKPLESVHQLPIETSGQEEKSETNPGVELAVDVSDKVALQPMKMDPVELTANETSIKNTTEDVGTKVHDDKIQTQSSQVLAVNSQSSILNSQSPSALLAFAGDPAALGMLARDAFGPDLVQAQILFLPEPVYPVLCRKRGEEGRVILEVTISPQGEVRRADIQTSSSYSRLDSAALDAVKMATFRPATASGVPVQSERTIAYRFRLEGK